MLNMISIWDNVRIVLQ